MRVREFESYIRDLLDHEDIQALRKTNAHWRRDRLVHNYAVGKLAYRLARVFHGNATVTARGGFLHDWYHGHMPNRQRFINPDQHHFRIAHEAAAKYGEHPLVLHAIRTHYWPWGRVRPHNREAWIVWIADNLIWVVDIYQSAKLAIRDGYAELIYGEAAS